jgi:hypothetical protein
MASPKGARNTVPAPAQTTPPAQQPSRVRHGAVIEAARASLLRSFMVSDRKGTIALAEVKVSSLKGRLAAVGKRAWTSAAEYNLLSQIDEWSRKQAFIAPGATVGDVLDDATFVRFRDEAIVAADTPLVILPRALEQANVRSASETP